MPTAASRLLVQEGIAKKFVSEIKKIFEKAGKSMGQSTFDHSSSPHGPVADQAQLDRIMSYISKGKNSATLVTGGEKKGSRGCFIEPTLFLNPDENSPIWTEEIFGPVLTVKTFKTEEEAIELANNSIYGLAGMFTLVVEVHMENFSAFLLTTVQLVYTPAM